jgi:hypothetical protein
MTTNPIELNAWSIVSNETVGLEGGLPAIEQTFLTDKLAQLLCDRYENSKSDILQTKEWTSPVGDFIPFIDVYARDEDHEDLARGLLARLFEQSYRQNADQGNTIEDFTLGVLDVLSQLRHVPDSLMRPRTQAFSKRQPSFFESMMGTIKRYKFMEALPVAFKGIGEGIIVGGSMGYGPFFSVRDGGHARDPSDVDAIIVMNDDYQSEKSNQQLLKSDQLKSADKVSLLSRFAVFAELQEQGKADIISQRFDVTGNAFNMSAHLMPFDFFEKMNGSQLKIDIKAGEDAAFIVNDYKPRLFEHKVCAQRSFDGSVHEYVVPAQLPVPNGNIAAITG